jgi:hypothetical protein
MVELEIAPGREMVSLAGENPFSLILTAILTSCAWYAGE